MKHELWDPFEEMKQFRKKIDDLFKEFWSGNGLSLAGPKLRSPLVDIVDRKNELRVLAELPGIDKRDVTLLIKRDRLEIRAEKRQEKEEKRKRFYRKERTYRGFYKVFSLPVPVNPDRAKADFDKGVLTIRLPKAKQDSSNARVLKLR